MKGKVHCLGFWAIIGLINRRRLPSTVTGHFGQDQIRPEKTWTFRPKAWTFRPRNIDVSAKEDGRFGQKDGRFGQKNGHFGQIYIFNSFTKRVLLLVGVITDWTVSVQWTRSCITERLLRTSIRVTLLYSYFTFFHSLVFKVNRIQHATVCVWQIVLSAAWVRNKGDEMKQLKRRSRSQLTKNSYVLHISN